MLDEAPEQYKAAQRSALIQRVVEADEMLETATDMVNVARSNSIAKYARWDAERRLPQLFGDKQGAQTGNITVVIRTLSGAETTVTIGRQGDQDAPAQTLTLDHRSSEPAAAQRVLDGGKSECA